MPLSLFGALCEQITAEPSLIIKEEIVRGFVQRFRGDIGLLLRLLLPKYAGRVYNTQEKQLVRVLSLVQSVPEDDIKNEWNHNGCIAETAQKFFKPKVRLSANGWCDMTMRTFDQFLDRMAAGSNEALRANVISAFFNESCANAVYIFFREVKLDLRLGAGLRIILNGLHPSAYSLFQHCANIQEVAERVTSGNANSFPDDAHSFSFDNPDSSTSMPVPSPQVTGAVRGGIVSAHIKLGVPLAPMLAAPARGIDQVLAKCPNGAFSEVKYDGERIQIHKDGDSMHFFARSLKPMKADKYAGLEAFLTQAIQANRCILDGEILMVDIKTSVPLPFGTLGRHKKAHFATACPCVFLFDILYKDGQSLLSAPLEERRAVMKAAVTFTRNRVMFSELCLVKGDTAQRRAILQQHLNRAIAEGLEGLVIKDVKSVYEPRARHWVKIKKDYLDGLADSADLLVLGAWYGSGSKGGQLSAYLMGCVDLTIPSGLPARYKTVCKVGNGLDDTTITVLTGKYAALMGPTNRQAPTWLNCHPSHLPDVVVRDPTEADVMEIIGAEFSLSKTHTSGVSFRFPRILRMRTDKSTDAATTLQELLQLFAASKAKWASAGVPDALQLVDCYTVSAPDENLNPCLQSPPLSDHPPTPSAASTADVQAAPLVNVASPGVSYSHGDACALPSADSESVILCHCCAVGGRWSPRGFMGLIRSSFGPLVEKTYSQCVDRHVLGDVVMAETGGDPGRGRVHVATMLAQQRAPRGVVPPIDHAALLKCLGWCVDFAAQHQCRIRFVKPHSNTQVLWQHVVDFLQEVSISKRLSITVYDALSPEPAGGGPADSCADAPPAKPSRASTERRSPPSTTHGSRLKAVVAQADSLPQRWWALLRKCEAAVVAASPERRQEIADLAEFLGATVVRSDAQCEPTSRCTHIIVDEAKDAPRSAMSSSVHLVTSQWLSDSLRDRRRYDEALYHPCRLKVLAGCRLLLANSLEGLPDCQRLANLLGATLQTAWEVVGNHSTYLVSSVWDDESERVFMRGGRVITPQWLTDSAVAQRPLPPQPYFLPRASHTPNPLEGVLCGLRVKVLADGLPLEMRTVLGSTVAQMGGHLTTSDADAQYFIATPGSHIAALSPIVRFRCLRPSWIWDCARRRALQDPMHYAVSTAHDACDTTLEGCASVRRRGSESSYSTETFMEEDDRTEVGEAADMPPSKSSRIEP